jgi:hypothetical protein
MWKIDSKDKHTHTYKHDTYIENMFVIMELFEGVRRGGKEKRVIVNNIEKTLHLGRKIYITKRTGTC